MQTEQPAVGVPVEPPVRQHSQTLRDLLACCRAWEADVRILGNVRAADAAAALEYVLSHIEAREKDAAGEKTGKQSDYPRGYFARAKWIP